MAYGVQIKLTNGKEVALEEWNPLFFIAKIPTVGANSRITRTYSELAGKNVTIQSEISTFQGSTVYYLGIYAYIYTISWNSNTGTLTITNNGKYSPAGYHTIRGMFA